MLEPSALDSKIQEIVNNAKEKVSLLNSEIQALNKENKELEDVLGVIKTSEKELEEEVIGYHHNLQNL
jgi:uncharacterized phage infection (PIP) family protein YhgE